MKTRATFKIINDNIVSSTRINPKTLKSMHRSSNYQRVALNDKLLLGPHVHQLLLGVDFFFIFSRERQIALQADVEARFLQVAVPSNCHILGSNKSSFFHKSFSGAREFFSDWWFVWGETRVISINQLREWMHKIYTSKPYNCIGISKVNCAISSTWH